MPSRNADPLLRPYHPLCGVLEHGLCLDVGDGGDRECAVDAPDVHLAVLVHHEAAVGQAQPVEKPAQDSFVRAFKKVGSKKVSHRASAGLSIAFKASSVPRMQRALTAA